MPAGIQPDTLAYLRWCHGQIGLPLDEIQKVVRSHEPDARGIHFFDRILQHIMYTCKKQSQFANILESAVQVNNNGGETLRHAMTVGMPLVSQEYNAKKFEKLSNTYDYQSALRDQVKRNYVRSFEGFFTGDKGKENELSELPWVDNRVRVQQKPDGMFVLTVKNKLGIEETRLLIVEIDGHAKDKSRGIGDSYRLSSKAFQGVDACRCVGNGYSKAYQVRVNVVNMDIEKLVVESAKRNHLDYNSYGNRTSVENIKDDVTKGLLVYHLLYEQLCEQIMYVLMAICFDIRLGNFIDTHLLSTGQSNSRRMLDYFFFVNFPYVNDNNNLVQDSEQDYYRQGTVDWFNKENGFKIMKSNRKPVFTAPCSMPGLVPLAFVVAVQRLDTFQLQAALREPDENRRSAAVAKIPGMMYLTDIIKLLEDAEALKNIGLIKPPVVAGQPDPKDDAKPQERFVGAYVPDGIDVPADEEEENYALLPLSNSVYTRVTDDMVGKGWSHVQMGTTVYDDGNGNKKQTKLTLRKIFWRLDPDKEPDVWNHGIKTKKNADGANSFAQQDLDEVDKADSQYKHFAHPNRILIARLVTVSESFLVNLHYREKEWWAPKGWQPIEAFSSKYTKLLRANPNMSRSRANYTLSEQFFDPNSQLPKQPKPKGLLNSICMQLWHEIPDLDEDLTDLVKPLNIPYALVFLKTIRCFSRLALQELAQKFMAGESLGRLQTTLDQFPVGTESELRFLFKYVQTDKASYLKKGITTTMEEITQDPITLLVKEVFGRDCVNADGTDKMTNIPLCNKIILMRFLFEKNFDPTLEMANGINMQEYIEQQKQRLKPEIWNNYHQNAQLSPWQLFFVKQRPVPDEEENGTPYNELNQNNFCYQPIFLPTPQFLQICVRDINQPSFPRYNTNAQNQNNIGSIDLSLTQDQNNFVNLRPDITQAVSWTPMEAEMTTKELQIWQAIHAVGDKINRNVSYRPVPHQSADNQMYPKYFDDTKRSLILGGIHDFNFDTDSYTTFCSLWLCVDSTIPKDGWVDVSNIIETIRSETETQLFLMGIEVGWWLTFNESQYNAYQRKEQVFRDKKCFIEYKNCTLLLCRDWHTARQNRWKNLKLDAKGIKQRECGKYFKNCFYEYLQKGPSWQDLMWKRLLIKLNFLNTHPMRAQEDLPAGDEKIEFRASRTNPHVASKIFSKIVALNDTYLELTSQPRQELLRDWGLIDTLFNDFAQLPAPSHAVVSFVFPDFFYDEFLDGQLFSNNLNKSKLTEILQVLAWKASQPENDAYDKQQYRSLTLTPFQLADKLSTTRNKQGSFEAFLKDIMQESSHVPKRWSKPVILEPLYLDMRKS